MSFIDLLSKQVKTNYSAGIQYKFLRIPAEICQECVYLLFLGTKFQTFFLHTCKFNSLSSRGIFVPLFGLLAHNKHILNKERKSKTRAQKPPRDTKKNPLHHNQNSRYFFYERLIEGTSYTPLYIIAVMFRFLSGKTLIPRDLTI